MKSLVRCLGSLFLSITILVSSAFAGNAAFASNAYDELTPAQQATVQKGQLVFFTVDSPESPWPKAYFYKRIEATPEESVAVFCDFDLQHTYIPSLLKSSISKRVSSRTFDVDYTLDIPVPFFPDENYTIRDTVSNPKLDENYRVDWTLVRADTMKATVGNVRYERLGTATLMAYYNFVTPDGSFASLVKDQALQGMKDTVLAFARQTEFERKNDSALLQRQVEVLRAALGR
jgi:hypothetical protein